MDLGWLRKTFVVTLVVAVGGLISAGVPAAHVAATGADVPELVNSATTATELRTRVEGSFDFATGVASPYASLDDPRKAAVAADLFASKPSAGYPTTASAVAMFDGLVAFRVEVKLATDAGNSQSLDLARLRSLLATTSALPTGAVLNGEVITPGGLTLFAGVVDANGDHVVADINSAGGTYASFTQMLVAGFARVVVVDPAVSPTGNGTLMSPYKNLDSVRDQLTGKHTVLVGAGQVTLDQPLILSGVSLVGAGSGAEGTTISYALSTGFDGIRVQGSGVTLQGFTLTAAGRNGNTGRGYGVKTAPGVVDLTVEDVAVVDVLNTAFDINSVLNASYRNISVSTVAAGYALAVGGPAKDVTVSGLTVAANPNGLGSAAWGDVGVFPWAGVSEPNPATHPTGVVFEGDLDIRSIAVQTMDLGISVGTTSPDHVGYLADADLRLPDAFDSLISVRCPSAPAEATDFVVRGGDVLGATTLLTSLFPGCMFPTKAPLPTPVVLQSAVGGEARFATLTAAVAAASDGDTIRVGAGIYNESVTVNKPLTILGPKADLSPVTGDWGEAVTQAVVTGTGSSPALTLAAGATGTVVRGLTLDLASTADRAVSAGGALSNVTLQRNRVVSPKAGVYATPYPSSGWLIDDNVFQAKAGTTNTGTGMFLWYFTGITVSANRVVGFERGVQIDGTAHIAASANWTITGNTFEGNLRRGLQVHRAPDGATVRVMGNTFVNNNATQASDSYSGALRFNGKGATTSATFVVTGNTFAGNVGSAVVWGDDTDITVSASNATFTDNTFNVPLGAYAVSYASLNDQTLNLRGNTWRVCASGGVESMLRRLTAPKVNGATPTNVMFDTANATITGCALANTTLTSQRSGTVTLSAQTDAGAGATVAFFVNGFPRGAAVTNASGMATLSAVLAPGAYQVSVASPNVAAPVPVTLNVFGRSVCASGCEHTTIQAAIDAAAPLETVTVGAGTYPLSSTLNLNGISLQGAGSGAEGTVLVPATSNVSTAVQLSGGTTANPSRLEGVRLAPTTSANATVWVFTSTAVAVSGAGVVREVAVVGSLGARDDPSAPRTTYGLNLSDVNDLAIVASSFISSSVGLKVPSTAKADNVRIAGSHFDGHSQHGIYVDLTRTATAATFDNVTITDSTFNDNALKGIYLERANNLLLRNVTVDGSGVSPTWAFNNGIDLNLKWREYSNIVLDGVTIRNSGVTTAALAGSPSQPWFSSALAIKSRDDASAYHTTPASLSAVTVRNSTIEGLENGIVFGEPNKLVTGVSGLVLEDNTITASQCALVNTSKASVPASGNWWGTAVADDVAARICRADGAGAIPFTPYLDGANGNPVVASGSILVTVRDAAGIGVAGVTVGATSRAAQLTGADGRVTFDALTPGTFTVTVSVGAAYTLVGQVARLVNLAVGQAASVDFSVVGFGSLSGSVLDTSGTGVAGVVVTAADKTATTNVAGRYTITDLGAGAYTVTLPATLPSGYTAAGPTARQVNLAAGQAATADFVLAQASSITGRVGDRNGTGVAGVTVTLTPPQGSAVTGVTDADGRYKFTGRNVFGLHTVSIAMPTGYVTGGDIQTTVNLAVGQLATADFVIVPTGVIAGRVLGTAGGAVAGVTVTLDRACVGSSNTTTTDLTGRYAFTGCTVSGAFTVSITSPSGFVAAGPASRTVTRPEGGSVGADFILAETSSISGRVVDTGGAGVAGIAVSLRSPDGGTFRSATSDLEGRFRFTSLAAVGLYSVTIPATALPDGFTLGGPAERAVNLASGQTAQVAFTLAQTSSISGAVLDTSGAPVAGVTVTLDPAGAGSEVVLVTGADGRFVRAGLTAGAFDVAVTVPTGFVATAGDTIRVNLANGATALAQFALARTSSIGGVVLDTSGSPLSGVAVRVTAVGGGTVDLVTGVDGRYQASGLASTGAHDVTVTVPTGFVAAGATSVRVNLGAGASATADFALARTSSVAGRVVDAAGVGVAGVTVTLAPVAGGTSIPLTTDIDGRFGTSGLTAGAYDASVGVPAGFVAASATSVRVNLTTGAATADFRLSRTSSITGRVVDDSLRGVAGVEVTVTGGNTVRSVLTDVTGRFEFSALTAALYTVTVPATAGTGLPAGYTPAGLTNRSVFLAVDRAATTEFVLSRNSAISGRVTDTVGSAVAGVTVNLTGAGNHTTTTGLDGRYAVAGLTAGAYDVAVAIPSGFSSGGVVGNRVNLVAGSSATSDFSLARTSSITGRVVNTTGAPVAGVVVTLTGSGSGTTTTRADGGYAFTALGTTGSHTVTITVPSGFGAASVVSRVVNLAAGQSASASFSVAEQGAITGRVVDNTGVGIAGVAVALDGGVATQTDLEGRYRLADLIAGSTRTVSVTLPGAYVQPVGQNLLVQSLPVGGSAQDVVLLPPGTVSGYAYVDLNGNGQRDEGEPPLAGVVATLTPSGATVTTSANGFYRYEGAQAGSQVTFTSPAGFSQLVATVVQSNAASDVRRQAVEVTAFLQDVGLLGTGTVVGYVTLNGEPLAGVTVKVGANTQVTSPNGVALFTGVTGAMTIEVPDGFELASTSPGSPVTIFALSVGGAPVSGGTTPTPPGSAPSTDVRERFEVLPVGVTPVTVTTPDGPVVLRFNGISVASGAAPEVVVRPLGYDATARGVQAAGPRFRITAERFAFDDVEVCVPVNSAAVRASGVRNDRIRLVHTRTDGTEYDITTRLDLTGTSGEVCGVADTFSTFQAAIVVSQRVAGDDRYATAASAALDLYPDGARTVYIATGADFPDALAAGAAAASADAPLLLVRRDGVPAVTRTALVSLRPTAIVLVGGTNAVSAAVQTDLASLTGVTVTRVAGIDRYATAALLAQRQFPNGASSVYVATGANFPDALAAGAAAAREGAALLLVPAQGVPNTVRDALVALAPQRIVVAGGTAAVSAAIESQLRTFAGTVERVAGIDRYDTAARLTAGAATGGMLVIATGQDFPDALVATALATRRGGAVLLAAGTIPPAATQRRAVGLAPTQLVVLGGVRAVTPTAELRLVRQLPPAVPVRL